MTAPVSQRLLHHSFGNAVNLPDGPSSRVGLYPAFSMASHIAFGDGLAFSFGVTLSFDASVSATTFATPATALSLATIFLAQLGHSMSSTAMTVTWRQRGVAYWTDGSEERVFWGTGSGDLV